MDGGKNSPKSPRLESPGKALLKSRAKHPKLLKVLEKTQNPSPALLPQDPCQPKTGYIQDLENLKTKSDQYPNASQLSRLKIKSTQKEITPTIQKSSLMQRRLQQNRTL